MLTAARIVADYEAVLYTPKAKAAFRRHITRVMRTLGLSGSLMDFDWRSVTKSRIVTHRKALRALPRETHRSVLALLRLYGNRLGKPLRCTQTYEETIKNLPLKKPKRPPIPHDRATLMEAARTVVRQNSGRLSALRTAAVLALLAELRLPIEKILQLQREALVLEEDGAKVRHGSRQKTLSPGAARHVRRFLAALDFRGSYLIPNLRRPKQSIDVMTVEPGLRKALRGFKAPANNARKGRR